MHEGIFILAVDGIKDLKGKNPLNPTSSSADNSPSIRNDQLLGFFANRGAEYVFEKCWGSGKDLTTVYLPQDNTIASAFSYGKKLGLFDDKTYHALFEAHAIVDDVQNKIHFFLMPRRMYFQDGKPRLE